TPLLPGTQSQPMNQSSSSPEDRSSSPDVLMSNSSSKSTPVSVAKKKPKGNDADASSSAAADLHGSVGTPAKAGDTVSSSVLSPAAAGSAVPGGGASGGEGVGVGGSCRSSGSGVGDGVGADVVFHDALSGRKMTQLKPPRDGGKLLSSPERRSSSHARSNFATRDSAAAAGESTLLETVSPAFAGVPTLPCRSAAAEDDASATLPLGFFLATETGVDLELLFDMRTGKSDLLGKK